MVAAAYGQSGPLKQLNSKLGPNFSQGEVPAKEGGFIQGIGTLLIKNFR
jgi:hypothetical protein